MHLEAHEQKTCPDYAAAAANWLALYGTMFAELSLQTKRVGKRFDGSGWASATACDSQESESYICVVFSAEWRFSRKQALNILQMLFDLALTSSTSSEVS